MTLRWAGGPAPLDSRSLIGSFEHRCPQTQSSGEHENPITEVAARDSCKKKRWEKSTQTAQAYSFTFRHYPVLLVSLTFQLTRKRAASGEFIQKFFACAKVFSPKIHEAASWNCEEICLKYMYYLTTINGVVFRVTFVVATCLSWQNSRKAKKKQPATSKKNAKCTTCFYVFLIKSFPHVPSLSSFLRFTCSLRLLIKFQVFHSPFYTFHLALILINGEW